MRQILSLAAIVLSGLAYAPPVAAKVHEETPVSFVVRTGVVVPASPEVAWDMLVRPSLWWSEAHTFSGNAANLSLHPRAGGCFCELLPNKDAPSAAPRGSVEHMRVVYAEDARALRMVGALGPMQSDAVTGVLTIVLSPGEAGTRILWEYAVSGHYRKPGMAASVDAMLTGQILRLGEKLGAGKAEDGQALGGEGEAAPTGDVPAPAGSPEPDANDQSGSAPPVAKPAQSPIIGR